MTLPDHQPIRTDPDDTPRPPAHIVVMGVSGSGKSTLAEVLGAELGVPMAEADEFHPPENIAKMAAQMPLTDEDRWPWLEALRDWMTQQRETGSVITCSALRRSYREVLREAEGGVVFLHVEVTVPRLTTRLKHRSGHFMPPALLDSQLATLEPLEPDENGAVLSNDADEADLIAAAKAWLGVERERKRI